MQTKELIIPHYQHTSDLIGDLVINYRTVGKGFYIELAILKNLTKTQYVESMGIGMLVLAKKSHPNLIEMVKFELND